MGRGAFCRELFTIEGTFTEEHEVKHFKEDNSGAFGAFGVLRGRHLSVPKGSAGRPAPGPPHGAPAPAPPPGTGPGRGPDTPRLLAPAGTPVCPSGGRTGCGPSPPPPRSLGRVWEASRSQRGSRGTSGALWGAPVAEGRLACAVVSGSGGRGWRLCKTTQLDPRVPVTGGRPPTGPTATRVDLTEPEPIDTLVTLAGHQKLGPQNVRTMVGHRLSADTFRRC